MKIEKLINEAAEKVENVWECFDEAVVETGDNTIYTHNEAANIIDIIEDVLLRNKICVPSPEDDERDPKDKYGFYGSIYYNILDEVEEHLITLLKQGNCQTKIITGVFA